MTKKERREAVVEDASTATRATLSRMIGNQGPKVAASIGIALALQKHAIPLFDKILTADIGFDLDITDWSKALEPLGVKVARETLEGVAGRELPAPEEAFKDWFIGPVEALGEGVAGLVTRTETKKAEVLTKIPAEDSKARERAEKGIERQFQAQLRGLITRKRVEDGLISFGVAWFLLTLAEEKTTTEIVNNIAEALPL